MIVRSSAATTFARYLLATGEPRPDAELTAVADVLCPAMNVRNYVWLVRQCGWSDDLFRRWYVHSVAGALLAPGRPGP